MDKRVCKYHHCPIGRRGCKLCKDLSSNFARGDDKFWKWKYKAFVTTNFPYLRDKYPGLDANEVFQAVKKAYYDSRSPKRFAKRQEVIDDRSHGDRLNAYLPVPTRRNICQPCDTTLQVVDIQSVPKVDSELVSMSPSTTNQVAPVVEQTAVPPKAFIHPPMIKSLPSASSRPTLKRPREDNCMLRRNFVEEVTSVKQLLCSIQESWYAWESSL